MLAFRVFVKEWLARLRATVIGPHASAVLYESGELRFLLPVRDFTIARKLAFRGSYQDEEWAGLQRLIRATQAKSVLFVGSHVGYFVIKVAQAVDKVHALEASPENFGFLKANVTLNEISNVEALNIAASARATELNFVMERENTGASRVARQGETPESLGPALCMVAVPARTVDSLGLSPEMAILDTEGHEIEVLKGMAETLPKLGALNCELIPEMAEAAGGSVAEQIDLLRPHFDRFHVDSLDAKAMSADEITAWFEALRGDDRRISRNVICLATERVCAL